MISKETQIAREIVEYLNANQDRMVRFLKQLVELESPSHDQKSQHEVLKLISRALENLGFFLLHVPGKKTGGYLYARPKTRKKNIPLQLLLGHCDTVWKKNTLKNMPISQHNGKLTGPGVYDMKAGLTELIFAIEVITKMDLSPSLTPIVLINSDEEIGSRESLDAIKRIAKISARAFVLEPPLGLDGKLKTARKGLGRFTITVTGKAAHAGLDPGKGANAIVELSHQIQQLYAMNDFEKGITVNVGTIEGGVSANVVAPESKAVIDVRVSNEKDAGSITKKIFGLKASMSNVKIRVEGGMGRPPMERTKRNRKLWQMAKTKALLLGLNLEEATAGGGSDGNTTSQFTATLDGLGATGDGAHAAHEYIFLNQLTERTALLALLILSGKQATVEKEML